MTNKFKQQFSVEELNTLRSEYNNGNESIAFDLGNVLGDRDTAKSVLEGPSDDLITYLKDNPDDQDFTGNFDNVYGIGASAHFLKDGSLISRFIDGSDKVAKEFIGGVAHGITGAIAETGEFITNFGKDALEFDGNAKAKAYSSRINDIEKQIASKGSTPELEAKLSDFKNRQRDAKRQLGEGSNKADFNSSQIMNAAGLEDQEPTTFGGQAVQGVTQFLTGMALPTAVGAKLQVASQVGLKGKVAASMVAGFISDATAFDPDDATLTQALVEEFDLPENVVTDYLTKTDEDGQYEKRFKSALEGTGLGLLLEGVFQGVRGVLKVRKGRRTVEEVQSSIREQLNAINLDTISSTKLTPEALNVRRSERPRVVQGHAKVADESKGVLDDLDATEDALNDTPVKPTLDENELSIQKAMEFVKSSDDAFDIALKEAEEGILKVDGNIVNDNPLRSHAALAKSARQSFSMINRHAKAGGEENWKLLTAWARRPQNVEELAITNQAFLKATQASRMRLNDIHKKLRLAEDSGQFSTLVKNSIEVELDSAAKMYFGLKAIDQDLGSEAGRLLNQRKSTVDITDGKSTNIKADDLTEEIKPKSEKVEYDRLRELGIKPSDTLTLLKLRRLEEANIAPKAKAKNVADIEKTLFEKFFEYSQVVRFGSMLSGTATHFVNIASSGVNGLRFSATELARPSTNRFAIDRQVGMLSAYPEAFKYAWTAAREMRPLLSDVSKADYIDPITKNVLLTWPLRVMTGTDELFRQVWFQGEVYAKAAQEGRLAGLDGDDLTNHITDRVKASRKDGVALDAIAEQNAAYLTFQRRFDKNSKYIGERRSAGIQNTVESYKLTQIIAPFSRVSLDLLDSGVRLTPVLRRLVAGANRLGEGSSRFLDDLEGTNGEIAKTRAISDLVQGWALTGAAVMLAANGKITGGLPTNYREANLERESSPPPYSIQIGDKWVSYDRYEPYSTPLKLVANLADSLADREFDIANGLKASDEEVIYDAFVATSFAFAEMASSQPYAEGLEDVMDLFSNLGDEGFLKSGKTLGTNVLESYIPNIAKKTNQALGANEGEFVVRDWQDMFTRHFSSFIPDYEGDKRRSDLTGKVKTLDYDHRLQRWFPAHGIDAVENDGIAMLREANKFYGSEFYLKQPSAFKGIQDMRKEASSISGRSLYDRYLDFVATTKAPEDSLVHGLDVGGLTYSEALSKLAVNSRFTALPWVADGVDLQLIDNQTTKKKWIVGLKSQYQQIAEIRLLKEDANYKAIQDEVRNELKQQNQSEFNSLRILE